MGRHFNGSNCDNQLQQSHDELRHMFSNISNLSRHFLSSKDEPGSTRNIRHGLDMRAAREFFQHLGQHNDVNTIREIRARLELNLLPMLAKSSPDVETLRFYLLLPECHFFMQPHLYSTIICPFANDLFSLGKKTKKELYYWWSVIQPSFFNRLVEIYRKCVEYILELPDTVDSEEVKRRLGGLSSCLKMLETLNDVNEKNNHILPPTKFLVPHLKDHVNICTDYMRKMKQQAQYTQGLYFCNFPFLYDCATKCLLLQTDCAFQMKKAMSRFMSIDPPFTMHVRTGNMTGDAFVRIQEILQGSTAPQDMKKPLTVVFDRSTTGVGVRQEFFRLLFREVTNPDFGMFSNVVSEDLFCQWFNPSTSKQPIMFKMLGILCGLAVYNSVVIGLDFPLAMYKKLLGAPVDSEDLKKVVPVMSDVIDFEGEPFYDTFGLTFMISPSGKDIELCKNGRDRDVTHENKDEYIKRLVDFYLNKSVKKQFNAFSEGFHLVCGGKVLESFHPEELQSLVVGIEDYDFRDLEKNAEYANGYCREDPVVNYFWEVCHEMELENKKKFLLFLTGSDRIPVHCTKHTKLVILPLPEGDQQDDPDGCMPNVLTCHGQLLIPRYSSKEILKAKLLVAIQQTEGIQKLW